VPNQIPLTQGLTASASSSTASPAFIPASPSKLGVPRSERAVYEQWVVWSRDGRFVGSHAIQDWANPAQLNRLDWYSAHGWKVPYPGDKKILSPNQVPGHSPPADYLGISPSRSS
jgi:hypothetical protein